MPASGLRPEADSRPLLLASNALSADSAHRCRPPRGGRLAEYKGTPRRDGSWPTWVGGGRGSRGVLGRSVWIVSLLSADIPGCRLCGHAFSYPKVRVAVLELVEPGNCPKKDVNIINPKADS